ncbi:deoxynucleoside triphosphate triphosphohydrolase SAMHD1-like [Strongylocentrotus purpuratus]|uniref:Deoxynucleoside triphosphate triphosphohydrolase SAMHD1 n=1 Tax=Strongylocentrotus purpuratus TaxID=7668 RepID=A0A7M7N769_STRPU|nr:deoxynucleoside triphosphate triphosphohydrolase SAMHD1-like [Strongylocentrotus purpuratus]
MTEERLEKIGVQTMGKRFSVVEIINALTRTSHQSLKTKVFNDSVHGHIDFDPLLIKIIDTPQFQRLRFIKQLGCSYFVFPGAAHNRFEHSLGVCYLARELVLSLQRKQPELEITDKDILCVQIAGLCHDLGHGPFSHMFDLFFIPKVRPDFKHKHEHLSVLMFDHLIKENHLEAKLKESGLKEQDLLFIREQIEGLPKDSSQNQNGREWLYKGRGREKSFLYEIVANKRNGIDVDKWDYFARDCYNLGIANSFDHKRYMKFARVIQVEGEKQICSRDKEIGNLYDMFHTRNTLHRRAYQHKVNKIIETMMVEALIKADPHLRIFPRANGTKLTMSESLDDMHAYTHLTDSVLEHILFSQKGSLKESKDIIQKILTRQLYKCVGQSQPPADTKLEKPLEISKAICLAVSEEELKGPQLDPDDLVVHVVKMDYGMGNQNPVDYVRFYSKEDLNRAIKIRKGQVSQMLPENFVEHYIRLYCKHRDAENVAKAERCFAEWCDKQKFSKPKPGNFLDSAMTPLDSQKRSGEGETRSPSEAKKVKKSLDDTYKSM